MKPITLTSAQLDHALGVSTMANDDRCRVPMDINNLDRGLCQRATGHAGDHSLSPLTNLESIGRSAYASILELVTALQRADQDGEAWDQARESIDEDPLSVEVRGAWQSVGDPPDHTPDEYRILLSTGGPATRIVGELTHGEPATARLQAQDWGTQWTDYHKADEAILLAYASIFYYEVG